MALYKVIVPFNELPSGGRARAGPGPTRCTTVEVEADSETEAKRLALSEFREMMRLSRPGAGAKVVERDIRAERATVSRRIALEVTPMTLKPGVASARLVGSITANNFGVLQQSLDGLQADGVTRLVLDLGGLSYVNSTGLSLFVAAGDIFDLRLASVPTRITRLLRMIGLDQIFPTYETVAEAADAPASTPGDEGADPDGLISWGPAN